MKKNTLSLDQDIASPIQYLRNYLTKFYDPNTVYRQQYFYHSALCANNWIQLAGSEDYPLATQGRKTLSKHIKDIITIIKDKTKSQELSFISLGVGNGKDDVTILEEALKKALKVHYFLYDISYPLISYTLNQVKRSKKILFDEIKSVTIINNDFLNIGNYKDSYFGNCPRLFSLLGSTISNFDEKSLLGAISKKMKIGDFLLLGVDCALDVIGNINHSDFISQNEKSEAGLEFLLGPIKYAKLLSLNYNFFNELNDNIETALDFSLSDHLTVSAYIENKSCIKNAVTVGYKYKLGSEDIFPVNYSHKYKTEHVIEFIENTIGLHLEQCYSWKEDNNIIVNTNAVSYTLLLFTKRDKVERQNNINSKNNENGTAGTLPL